MQDNTEPSRVDFFGIFNPAFDAEWLAATKRREADARWGRLGDRNFLTRCRDLPEAAHPDPAEMAASRP